MCGDYLWYKFLSWVGLGKVIIKEIFRVIIDNTVPYRTGYMYVCTVHTCGVVLKLENLGIPVFRR